jgi:hypothetical protein
MQKRNDKNLERYLQKKKIVVFFLLNFLAIQIQEDIAGLGT